jgi:voltage-gated potassium channel Kch
MALSPLLMIINDTLVQPRFQIADLDQDDDEIDERENPVIIAGFGRFGQIPGRLLKANGFNITVLDHNPGQIELLRRFGWKVFYGDASRVDLLRAAGAEQAKLIIVAIDDREKILETVETIHKHFPNVKILARAVDRRHAYELIRQGADVIERETFGSALETGIEALKLLGVRAYKAHRAAQMFKDHDEDALREIALIAEDETLAIARARQLSNQLEELLQTDNRGLLPEVDRAWDVSELVQKSVN